MTGTQSGIYSPLCAFHRVVVVTPTPPHWVPRSPVTNGEYECHETSHKSTGRGTTQFHSVGTSNGSVAKSGTLCPPLTHIEGVIGCQGRKVISLLQCWVTETTIRRIYCFGN